MRGDDDGIEAHVAAARHPHPGQATGIGFDLLDRSLGDGDAAGLELLALLTVRNGTGVLR